MQRQPRAATASAAIPKSGRLRGWHVAPRDLLPSTSDNSSESTAQLLCTAPRLLLDRLEYSADKGPERHRMRYFVKERVTLL